MTDPALDLRYHAARSIIRELGDVALGYFNDQASLGVTMKGEQDWLTIADGTVERLFREKIAALFPGDAVFGEEQGGGADAGVATAENLWIIDPIDGTANFVHGDRQWCIAVGFLKAGRPVLGFVLSPALGEFFTARRGGGAFMNDRPIRPGTTADMRKATIEIGWSGRRPASQYLDAVRACMEAGANVKRSASGALGIMHAAMGRTDGYTEAHINSWDVAGALVIAEAAGCVTNDFFRGEAILKGNPVLVAAPGVAEAMRKAIGFEG